MAPTGRIVQMQIQLGLAGFSTQMGNKVCWEEEARESEPEGQLSRLQEETARKDEASLKVELLKEPPTLDENILETLMRQKPLERQFAEQRDKVVAKIDPSTIYHGPLDQRGLPHGFGRVFNVDGTLMLGPFEHGIKVGEHYFLLVDGSFYRGTIQQDEIRSGSFFGHEDFTYTGQFEQFELHGRGKEHHKDYDFEGIYWNDRRVEGALKWKELNFGNQYVGSFDALGRFESFGELSTRQGVYKGQFKGGMKEGRGTFAFANGLTYEGDYCNDEKHGLGKIINSNGSVCYEGEFQSGLPQGRGKAWDESGCLTEGDFIGGVAATHYNRMQESPMRKSLR